MRPYDTGLREDVFIRNPDGTLYIGTVWPGDSVFPDFTLSRVRDWWGGLYRDFVRMGAAGYWNDMNEPSVFACPATRCRWTPCTVWTTAASATIAPSTTSTACSMRARPTRAAEAATGRAPVRAHARGLRRHAALCRDVDRRQHRQLAPPGAEHAEPAEPGTVGLCDGRRRHRRFHRLAAAGPADALVPVGRVQSGVPQPRGDRHASARGLGRRAGT